MIILRIFPVILSIILMAAHFSRADQTIPAIISLIFPLFLLIKKRIIIRLFQVVLILGGAEWVRSMFSYIEVRKSVGDDYMRLAVILSAVAIFTAASGLFLQNKKILDIYKS